MLQSVSSRHPGESAPAVATHTSHTSPPQSGPVSPGLCVPLLHIGSSWSHAPPSQYPETQSPSFSHALRKAQVAPHEPPQSTSVSDVSFEPFEQIAASDGVVSSVMPASLVSTEAVAGSPLEV